MPNSCATLEFKAKVDQYLISFTASTIGEEGKANHDQFTCRIKQSAGHLILCITLEDKWMQKTDHNYFPLLTTQFNVGSPLWCIQSSKTVNAAGKQL